MPPDPAAIARRLSERERKAMFKMPRHHSMLACATRLTLFLEGLQLRGTLTPLGLLVRAELERMEARDE